jgi:hypothetical protein
MSIQAMKQALEALEFAIDQLAKPYSTQAQYAITSLRQAIAKAEKQEPVAWMHNFIDGGISIGKRPSDLDRHPDRWTALYKEPNPCPTCEALARTVMMDMVGRS